MDELPPPRPLTLPARHVWDRNAKRVYDEGRWNAIDHELLAVFAETMDLYLQFTADIKTHGTLVQGRNLQEKVRNPSLIGLAQCRTDLIRLAKAIPLIDLKGDRAGADVNSFLEELMGE